MEELLNRQENRVLLDGLEKASQRVEMARRELAEIERQELEAKQLRDYINQLESRASEVCCFSLIMLLGIYLFNNFFYHSSCSRAVVNGILRLRAFL